MPMPRLPTSLITRPLRAALILMPASCVLAWPALAGICPADDGAIAAALARLEPRYGDVLSDISCDAPTLPAHQILCGDAEGPNPLLWQMARLDTLAWVYAVENATGAEQNHASPMLDDGFIASRDACTDAACLCAALIQHTTDSLGGESPY